MPFLFLSPSTQDFNPYVTTGNEQYWMNRIADEMEPYLRASGVNFTRNNPAGSAAQSIRDSNAGSMTSTSPCTPTPCPRPLPGRPAASTSTIAR